MTCFELRIVSAQEMDDDIHPIYNYLKRRGWSDALDLLSCTNSKPPNDFLFDDDNADPFKVSIRPIEHPTELFMAIQRRDWGAALDCLHRKPAEASTWIYRETDFPENEMLWKLLPLHASIALGAPAYLILELLDTYPDAAKKLDLNKSLPIHLAASRVDIDIDGERILQNLLTVFPESAGVVNGRGKLPIELAYGAQLRKDKRNKVHSWCIDTRETQEEGFELQLEMRDVMESFNSENKNIYHPTWSVPGPTNSSSSYSSRSEISCDNIAYPFLTSTYPKLGTIPESNSKTASPISSSSSSSSSTDDKKTIGFQSICVSNNAQPSSSSLSLRSSIDSSNRSFVFSHKSTRSSSSRAMSKLRSFLSRSRSMEGKKPVNCFDSDENNRGIDSRTKTDSGSFELDTQISSSESNNSGEEQHKRICSMDARSYEVPRMPQMYPSPARSLPTRFIMTRPHFSSEEKKPRTGVTSFDKDSKDNGESMVKSVDCKHSLAGVLKPCRSQQQQEKDYEHSRSFDIPAKQLMYTSPARSLPSSLIASFTRSKTPKIEYNAFGEDFSVGEESRRQTGSDSNNLDVSFSKSSILKQQRFVKKKAHSFDLPPTQSVHCSPPRSLPSSLRVFGSRSQRTDEKASNIDCGSFGKDSKFDNEKKSCESIDLKNNALSGSREVEWLNQDQQVYKGTRSFDIPTKQTMYCSPARSLPLRFSTLTSNTPYPDMKKSDFFCAPFVKESTSENEVTFVSRDGNDSTLRSLNPNCSKQVQELCKHARSFEYTPTQLMYSFPATSLPSPARMLKLRSQGIWESKFSNNNDAVSFGGSGRPNSESSHLKSASGSLKFTSQIGLEKARSFGLPAEQSMVSCPVSSLPPRKAVKIRSSGVQQTPIMDCGSSKKCPSFNCEVTAEDHAESTDLNTTSKSSKVSKSNHENNGYRRTRSFDRPPNQSLYSSPARSLPESTMRSKNTYCLNKDIMVRSSGVNGNHFIDTTESEEYECSLLGVVTSNHYDENQVEDVTSDYIEGDPVLVDFIEEAISNIGREKNEIGFVLKEMHERHIDKIDDLLKVDSKVLAASFADKELGMEMKRLLDEPEYEMPFDSNYDAEDFLCDTSDSGSHSAPV